jgi:two-component system NtrC family sensor kinase
MIENIDLGIAWIDPDFRVILSNSAIGRLCGKPSADFVGSRCHEIFWDQEGNCPDCPGKEAMMTGKSVIKEVEKDSEIGERLQVRVHAFPTFAEDGSVTGFVKVVEDISRQKKVESANHALKKEIAERKRIEEELKSQQEKHLQQHDELNQLFLQVQHGKKEWETTLDCIKEVVVLIDEQGRIRRCNKALAALTGKGYEDLIGREFEAMFEAERFPIGNIIRQQGEVCHQLNGRWFLVNTYRLDEVQGGAGAVITLYDYTSLKQLNLKLEDTNRMLEVKGSQLEEAYAELKATQIRILQQEKMATIGQLAAGVAHEINNPIGFITSNLRTLEKYLGKLGEFIKVQADALRASGDQAALEAVARARKEHKLDYIAEDIGDLVEESLEGAERVRKIVQDLKTFSRVNEAEWQFVNLVEGLESTITIVWNEIKYKATLVRDFAELPPVRCYSHQLNQVFMNLLVNAAQAIDKEGRITVKAWQEGEAVAFSVADTGCGIPPENLNQIFMPFFTTKEAGKGTGLGLSVSYEIVQKHQGEILVDSELGKGTTFTVRIPIDARGQAGQPEA